MNKNIHFILLFLIFHLTMQAQSGTAGEKGYYQTVDLNPQTECGCEKKTPRTYELSKGLVPYDMVNFKAHAYKFSFGSSRYGVSKLFKAFENDLNVYKISMKEWDSFMLLTNDKFDVASFEEAAKSVFDSFTPITTEEFLLKKNTSAYNEYVKFKQETQNTSTNKQ